MNLFFQGPGEGLDQSAFNLVADTIRVDNVPAVSAGHRAQNANSATLAIDINLKRHGTVARDIFVFGKPDAAATAR